MMRNRFIHFEPRQCTTSWTFPELLAAARIVKLEQNYRSVQPILDASNAVIGLAAEANKGLFSTKILGEKPRLINASDEAAQGDYVVERVLAHREAGIRSKAPGGAVPDRPSQRRPGG